VYGFDIESLQPRKEVIEVSRPDLGPRIKWVTGNLCATFSRPGCDPRFHGLPQSGRLIFPIKSF
jgi:hypothetical protein